MKKTDYVFETKEPFELKKRYKDIAEVKNNKGWLGIVDMNTNELIAEFDHYVRTIYDEKNGLLIQIKEELTKTGNFRRAVRIFDIDKKEIICEDWDITNEITRNLELAILQNPSTRKYHIFNRTIYRNESNGFKSEQDVVYYLGCPNNIDYLAGERYGKQAFYTSKTGFESGYVYNSIDIEGQAIMFEAKPVSWFNYYDKKGNFIYYSGVCDNVRSDGPFIICTNNSLVSGYYIDDDKDLCRKVFNAEAEDAAIIDQPKYNAKLNSYDYHIALCHEDGDELAVISINEEGQVTKKLTKLSDGRFNDLKRDFNHDDTAFVVIKDKKKGLVIYDGTTHYIEPIYDEIFFVLGNKLCVGFKGDVADIFNPMTGEILVSDCAVDADFNSIMYCKDGKYGVVDVDGVNGGYDSLHRRPGNYFITELGGKKGVLNGSKTLLEPQFKEADVYGSTCTRRYLLKCMKENGKYDLYRCSSLAGSLPEKVNAIDLNNVEFYDGFAILKDDEKINIYSFIAGNIETFEPTSNISVNKYIGENNKTITIVNVDGTDYKYNEETKSFEVVPTANKEIYASSFEGTYGTVIVSDNDIYAYEEKCRQIENMTDEGFDKVLLELYDKKPKLQLKYPNLRGDK